MLSSRLIRPCAMLLLIVAALAPLGCKTKSAEPTSPAGGASAVASSAVTTRTGVATGTSSPGAAAASQEQSSGKITASEAAALDAELAAIQKELDKLSIPGDSDFGDIESGLK